VTDQVNYFLKPVMEKGEKIKIAKIPPKAGK
jgi:hypothetical protein